MTIKYQFTRTLFFIFVLSASPLLSFRLGLENISDTWIKKIKGARIGLITNQTGKDQHGKRNIDILKNRGLNIKAILVPEHGLDGTISAEHEVPNTIDATTGIPIVSLYKQNGGREITKELVTPFDILIFDIQDTGMRHYTYIWTLYTTLEAAAKFNKQYIVLDRPNPLGYLMEGPLVDATLTSFIGLAQIPLRHGLTIGELALVFNKHFLEKKARLHVIRMQDYKRTDKLEDKNFCALSPHIATLQSCYGYSFLGLLGEIRPFEVGIGTDKAFQLIALPEKLSFSEKQWNSVKTVLRKHGVQSAPYNAYNQRKKKRFRGLEIKINDINKTTSFSLLLELLPLFKSIKPHYSDLFDKATGTRRIRNYWSRTISHHLLAKRINENLNSFLNKIRPLLLYFPEPKPVTI